VNAAMPRGDRQHRGRQMQRRGSTRTAGKQRPTAKGPWPAAQQVRLPHAWEQKHGQERGRGGCAVARSLSAQTSNTLSA